MAVLHWPRGPCCAPAASCLLLTPRPAALAIKDYYVSTAVEGDGSSAALSLRVRLGGAAAAAATAAEAVAGGAAAGGAAGALGAWRVRASLHGPYVMSLDAPPPRAAEVWRDEAAVTLLDGAEAEAEAEAERAGAAAAEGEAGGLMFGGAGAAFAARLDAPALWSAETPALYTLVVELWEVEEQEGRETRSGAHAKGRREVCRDVEACRVGVRHVAIADSLLRVNGAPLTVRGVNRHEHSAEGGKAVSWDEMVTDVTMLKQANFNAVRTAHYPNCTAFYELCDALGLYVVDEANIGTPDEDSNHGAALPASQSPHSTALRRAAPPPPARSCPLLLTLSGRAPLAPPRVARRDPRLLLRAVRRRGRARQDPFVAARLSHAPLSDGPPRQEPRVRRRLEPRQRGRLRPRDA